MNMKVLGINGSMRKDGNTAIIIRTIFEELEKEGISTELIQLPDVHINHAGLHRVKTAWHAWEKKTVFLKMMIFVIFLKR